MLKDNFYNEMIPQIDCCFNVLLPKIDGTDVTFNWNTFRENQKNQIFARWDQIDNFFLIKYFFEIFWLSWGTFLKFSGFFERHKPILFSICFCLESIVLMCFLNLDHFW